MLPLKLVTFDVTGTLLFFREPVFDKYVQTAVKYGVHPDPKILKKNSKEAWNTLSEEHPNFGKKSGITWQDWWKNFVERTFKGYIPPQDSKKVKIIVDDMLQYYRTREAFTIRPKTEELLVYLRKKDLKLGIISNYDPRLSEIVQLTGLRKFFNFVIGSYDFGYPKPDKRIFEEALKLSGCRAQEALHVGDDIENDYFGAKQAGFRSFLISTECNHKEVHKNEVFKDFEELKKYFEKL